MSRRSAAILATISIMALSACGIAERRAESPGNGAGSATPFTHSTAADSVLSAGEATYKRGEYDSARVILERGRLSAVHDGDSAAVARALTWLGLTSWKQGKYSDARVVGERALQMKLRLRLNADLFRSYNALGLLAHAEGRLSDAAALFAKAHASAREAGDSASIAKALGNLGLVHADAGAFDIARTEFAALVAGAQHAGDSVAEGNALANLGMLEVRSGNASAAIERLSQARRAYGSPDPAQEENLLGHLSTAYSALGEPQRAIAYIDSALTVARAHDLKLQESEDLQLLAELFGEAGDHQRSLEHLARARRLGETIGADGRVGEIDRARARELTLISRTDVARSAAREAIATHRAGGFRLEEMRDQLLLAEIAQLSGHAAEATGALRSADSLAGKLNLDIARENVALGRARVADAAKNAAAVLAALPTGMTSGRMGPSAEGEAFALRARAFARLGQWPEAVNSGRQAVKRLDGVRQKFGEGPLRASYISEQSLVYADLVVALLRVGATDEAFEVADAARGKSLLEHLAALGREGRGTTADIAESRQLLRRIDWLTERLRLADTIPARERSGKLRLDLRDLSTRLAEARRDYEDRMKRVALGDPRGAALMGIAPARAGTVRSSLAPGEVLIEYLATSGGLLIFAATRDTIRWVESPVTLDELAARVRLASGLASRKGTQRPPQVLRALYKVLIEPVEKVVPLAAYPSVVIIPHATLSYLPFAALIGSSGKYFVEDHSIVLLPSASALPYLRKEEQPREESRTSVFAPFPDELPGTRAEATMVSRSVLRPVSYFAGRATEKQLREVLAVSGTVHVASHAELNQESPMFSHVEVARGRPGNPADDGRFDVHELLTIPVRSRLVFLSGCETGAGASWSTAFRRTQDYATLSQAFLYAGARDVVATLWRIDDRGASVFAGHFYSGLATRPAADALATAQRAMIRDPVYSSPRYWAAYTISGTGRSSPLPQLSRVMPVKYVDPTKGPDR